MDTAQRTRENSGFTIGRLSMWNGLLMAILTLAAAAPAGASDLLAGGAPTLGPSLGTAKAGVGCDGGLRYDDGTFETGYGWHKSTPLGSLAMRFDLPGARNRVEAVCICWSRF